MVKSGILNSFPYVSSNLGPAFFRSADAFDARDDNDVDDGDCFGVFSGEAESEFEDDEGSDSAVAACCNTRFRGVMVDDMMKPRDTKVLLSGMYG